MEATVQAMNQTPPPPTPGAARSLRGRAARLAIDALESLQHDGPPVRRVFDREYMAAWHQFHDMHPADVRTLVDVGAHDGLYARRAARYFSLTRSILVEPLAEHAARLRGLSLPGLSVVEAALSDHVGEARFCVNATAQASSLRDVNPAVGADYRADLGVSHQTKVVVTTLDRMAEAEAIDTIDLLKIDVQGNERELLLGAVRTLPRVRSVQIEVLFVEHYFGCAQFRELDDMLRQAGFVLSQLRDFTRSPGGALLQADAVYLNRRTIARSGT